MSHSRRMGFSSHRIPNVRQPQCLLVHQACHICFAQKSYSCHKHSFVFGTRLVRTTHVNLDNYIPSLCSKYSKDMQISKRLLDRVHRNNELVKESAANIYSKHVYS